MTDNEAQDLISGSNTFFLAISGSCLHAGFCFIFALFKAIIKQVKKNEFKASYDLVWNYPQFKYTEEIAMKQVNLAESLDEQVIKIRGVLWFKNMREMIFVPNFDFVPSNVYILYGSAGSGKSKLLSIIDGGLEPQTGTIVYKRSLLNKSFGLREENVSYFGKEHKFLKTMTIGENIDLKKQMQFKSDALDKLVIKIGIADKRDLYPRDLSAGLRRKLDIVLTLMIDVDVYLFDEPFVGIDKESIILINEYINELKDKRIVVISTSSCEEAEMFGDVVVLFNKGIVEASGTTNFLRRNINFGFELSVEISENCNFSNIKKDLICCNNDAKVMMLTKNKIVLFYENHSNEMRKVLEYLERQISMKVIDRWSLRSSSLDSFLITDNSSKLHKLNGIVELNEITCDTNSVLVNLFIVRFKQIKNFLMRKMFLCFFVATLLIVLFEIGDGIQEFGISNEIENVIQAAAPGMKIEKLSNNEEYRVWSEKSAFNSIDELNEKYVFEKSKRIFNFLHYGENKISVSIFSTLSIEAILFIAYLNNISLKIVFILPSFRNISNYLQKLDDDYQTIASSLQLLLVGMFATIFKEEIQVAF